jgi:hypothetical protein
MDYYMIEKGKHPVLSVICHGTWTGLSISSLIIICLVTMACSTASYPEFDQTRAKEIINKFISNNNSISSLLSDSSISKAYLYNESIDNLNTADFPVLDPELRKLTFFETKMLYNRLEAIESKLHEQKGSFILFNPRIVVRNYEKYRFTFTLCYIQIIFIESLQEFSFTFIHHNGNWYIFGI